MKEQIWPTWKNWLLVLNPPVPHHRIQGVTKIVPKRHCEGAKVLRYWEVLQLRGANEYLYETPRVTRAGTYGKGNAPLRGCIRLPLLITRIQVIAFAYIATLLTLLTWIIDMFGTPLTFVTDINRNK